MDTAVTLRFASQPVDLSALGRALRGRIIEAGDPSFDDERQVWNLAHSAQPLAIVRAADARA